ncbi:MAG: NAD-dependent epimerase/dehydratase family protein [Mycobacterium sp.]|uniref:NAD-dependent epimerase/dehydratase family protein n=1 Tax=Mycobacterium sp. TaxID=1785 RepID=UPI003CC65643
MRIAVTGASGVVGRGVVARLLSQGHDVVGLARRRPQSWPSAATFVESDVRDAAGVKRAVAGADVVAHFAWAVNSGRKAQVCHDINVGGTSNVLDAIARDGVRRIVFASSALVYGAYRADTAPLTEDQRLDPISAEGRDKAGAEQMLAASGAEWVVLRPAVILSREVDNWVRRFLASLSFPNIDGSAAQPVQVLHSDDAHRVFVRAVLDSGIGSGPVNLAAPGETTLGDIARRLGRPTVPLSKRLTSIPLRARLVSGEHDLFLGAPRIDTSQLRDGWRFAPAWTADQCVDDVALAVRGRISLGNWSTSLPWRLTHAQDIPAVDAPAADGLVPQRAGPAEANGEFDTPIDPRFPTYLATNLSEALPGPFSPSSASVTVRGLRAGGAVIAQRLRPGGLIQREMATRTIGVFAHRLYGAITTAHFMAETVPFVEPATVIRQSQFFGRSVAALPIQGDQTPAVDPHRALRPLRTLRNLGVFAVNLIGLTTGAARDTADYIDDLDRLEEVAAGDLSRFTDGRLQSLMLVARDHVIHGWVLAMASFMSFAALSVILRGLSGRDTVLPVGQELVSAQPLTTVYRLVDAARRDPVVLGILSGSGDHLDELAAQAPQFHAAVLDELKQMGHRGPAEVEMRSASYADDPELLLRMVAKSLHISARPQKLQPVLPMRVRPVALLAAYQLRDREVRRDKMVRAIWLLRNLLREYGRRRAAAGVFHTADDVFYLLVDELDALPPDVTDVVARRRAEQVRLAGIQPPPMFSGNWQATTALATVLAAGETLHGVGVCSGLVRGRVRIVRPETIDDLEPGEILVAEVTDVGYTAAFSYAAAVVTELGGPMSHAAVVAREFGIPCVVDAQSATRRLPPGSLIEVDGATGQIRVLDAATDARSPLPADDRSRKA